MCLPAMVGDLRYHPALKHEPSGYIVDSVNQDGRPAKMIVAPQHRAGIGGTRYRCCHRHAYQLAPDMVLGLTARKRT